ncbi:hypothetical protein D3729_22655 [Vibrio parahaemolyticus]|nr:hypothetical protein [Vibrio parahaemolyticus]
MFPDFLSTTGQTLTSLFRILSSTELSRAYNAALSGEQRQPPYLNHCAVNTKVELNQKCRALRIRLKRFVRRIFKGLYAYPHS